MPCFRPIKAFYGRKKSINGKGTIVFHKEESCGIELDLPCGQCIGCRLEKSRQWAIRCVHEASLHADNCFLTLTYDPKNLPDNGSLKKKDYQDFMKRLRARNEDKTIRFFHCGEYGDNLSRPHYHACLFGYDFPDKVLHSDRRGVRLYTSDLLNDVWPWGFTTLGDVTFESAAYVARYVMKKVTGDEADEHYRRVHPITGAEYLLEPEYITMSRRPGLAAGWYEKWKNDVYPSDEVISRGNPVRPPRFYDKMFEEAHGDTFKELKRQRIAKARKHKANQTPERLKVREICTEARIKNLKRGFEE